VVGTVILLGEVADFEIANGSEGETEKKKKSQRVRVTE
jgi:hypothetical protein